MPVFELTSRVRGQIGAFGPYWRVMRSLFLMVFLSFAGCAPHVGPDGAVIGGPCVDDLDCAAGSFCLTARDYPGGTCTTNCDDDGECRGDSACIESRAGVCLLRCDEDLDCGRGGYVCRSRTSRGVAGQSMVCVGG